MAWSDYLVPGITAVTAITTGFGAAALKHRWDVQDTMTKRRWEMEDRTNQWKVERLERRREELKTAFSDYLAARAQVGNVLALAEPGVFKSGIFTNAVNVMYGHASQLRVLLGDDNNSVVYEDVRSVHEFLTNALRIMRDDPDASRPPMPSDAEIRFLAHELISKS